MAPKFSQSVLPITDLKTRAKDILHQLHVTGEPILITQRGRGTAVMESLERYEERIAYYEAIEGLLTAMRQADAGELHAHADALKILDTLKRP